MKLAKGDMIDLWEGYQAGDNDDILLTEVVSRGRNSRGRRVYYERLVFRHEKHLYETTLEWPVGREEDISCAISQWPDFFECHEVVAIPKTIIVYSRKK